jgi:hypothetical protein
VAASVEESLTNNFISELPVAKETQGKGRFDHQRNLQESLDVLHDCLIFSKPVSRISLSIHHTYRYIIYILYTVYMLVTSHTCIVII